MLRIFNAILSIFLSLLYKKNNKDIEIILHKSFCVDLKIASILFHSEFDISKIDCEFRLSFWLLKYIVHFTHNPIQKIITL